MSEDASDFQTGAGRKEKGFARNKMAKKRKIPRKVVLRVVDNEDIDVADIAGMLSDSDVMLQGPREVVLNKRSRETSDVPVNAASEPSTEEESDLDEQYDSRMQRKSEKGKLIADKLPVKSSSGNWMPILEEEHSSNSSEEELSFGSASSPSGDEGERRREKSHGRSKIVQEPNKQSLTFEEKCTKLGDTCLAITQAPEQHLHQLKTVRGMLDDRQMYTLAMTSMLAVFVDILPGYPIRPLGDLERAEKVSKEVKATRQFEQGVLRFYRDFLVVCRDRLKQRQCRVAMQVIGQLLVRASHFNYFDQLVLWTVQGCLRGEDACCAALTSLFRNDITGSATLHAVRTLSNAVKDRGYDRLTTAMPLRVLLGVSLRESPIGVNEGVDGSSADVVDKAIIRKQKRSEQHRSKRERKQLRVQKAHAASQLVTETAVSGKERQRWNSETLKFLFRIYFGVLQMLVVPISGAGESSQQQTKSLAGGDKGRMQLVLLVPEVMAGLSRFAGYISIEYFADLTRQLRQLIALDTKERFLPLDASLNCIQTVVHVHRYNEQLGVMDLKFVYDYFYSLLLSEQADIHRHSELVDKVFRSLFVKQQSMLVSRVCAFLHRINDTIRQDCILLKQLEWIYVLLENFPASRVVLDNDSTPSSFNADVDPDLGDAKNRYLDFTVVERLIRECSDKSEKGKLGRALHAIKRLAVSED